jgi:outer membrane protein
MTKFNSILSVILALAVAYLLFDKFNSAEPEVVDTPAIVKETTDVVSENRGLIAYIDIDSLNENYHLLDENYEQLDKFRRKIEGGLQRRMNNAQSKIESYRESITTEEQYMQAQQELQNDQLAIQKYQEDKAIELAEMEQNLQLGLYTRLEAFLEDFNRENGYDYVVGYQKGGQVLYRNNQLNITDQVIDGLNAIYDAEQLEEEKAE